MLEFADSFFIHKLLGAGHNFLVIPTEGNNQMLANSVCSFNQVPGMFWFNRYWLFTHHVRAGF